MSGVRKPAFDLISSSVKRPGFLGLHAPPGRYPILEILVLSRGTLDVTTENALLPEG
jgi:hypothetical protein